MVTQTSVRDIFLITVESTSYRFEINKLISWRHQVDDTVVDIEELLYCFLLVPQFSVGSYTNLLVQFIFCICSRR